MYLKTGREQVAVGDRGLRRAQAFEYLIEQDEFRFGKRPLSVAVLTVTSYERLQLGPHCRLEGFIGLGVCHST